MLSAGDVTASAPQLADKATEVGPPLIRGDWVLFHPVYTPEELRAVEVRYYRILESPSTKRSLAGPAP